MKLDNNASDQIPRIIHFCWFGGASLPDKAKEYIMSWKKYCPNYQIKEWNEKNFDINSNQYVKEAYDLKKWAFITDYVRLYVLDKYGGVYMDVDVELLQNIDRFLKHGAFSGFQTDTTIPTGIMGAKKGNLWIKKLLSYYKDKHFYNKDRSADLTTNVTTITDITKQFYGLKCNDKYQVLKNDVVMYPKEYFCPKNLISGKIKITSNTYSIHHFNGSWLDDHDRKIIKMNMQLYSIFGEVVGQFIVKILLFFIFLKKNGLTITAKKLWRYLFKLKKN